MKSEVTVMQDNSIAAFAMDQAEVIETLRNSVYSGAKESSVKLVLSWCKASRKDPFKRPVHIVPMSVKVGDKYEKRDTIMEGIGNLRTDAARALHHAIFDF